MDDEADSPYYIVKSYEEVEQYLSEIRRKVNQGQFKVSEREDKNLPFMRMYNLASKGRQREMLLKLCTEDFVHAIPSKMEGNEGQELFVFVKKFPLHMMLNGLVEKWVYIKFDLKNGENQNVIVISFHEAERIPASFPYK